MLDEKAIRTERDRLKGIYETAQHRLKTERFDKANKKFILQRAVTARVGIKFLNFVLEEKDNGE